MERIYVTDLDGTLLNKKAQLSQYSYQTLYKLLQDGAKITIASARSFSSIKKIMGDLPIKLPIIEINGSYLSDYQTGKHLLINDIPADVSEGICRICNDFGLAPFVAAYDGKEDHLFYELLTNEGMEWFLADKTEDNNGKLKQSKINEQIFNMNIVCFVIIGKDEDVSRLNDIIKANYGYELDSYFFSNPYCPQWQWLTIHDKKAQKSTGVRELLEITGFSYEQLTVFGDGDNDEAMMQLNELGAESIAVENATDKIKKIASKIALSNEDDGVVRYIAKQFYNSKSSCL